MPTQSCRRRIVAVSSSRTNGSSKRVKLEAEDLRELDTFRALDRAHLHRVDRYPCH